MNGINLIKDILLSPAGSFAAVFSLFAIAFWLVYYITRKSTQINSSHDSIKGSIVKVESHVDEIRRDISYLKGTIDVIKSIDHPLSKSNSPIALSDTGMKVLENMNAYEIIGRNWNKIVADIDLNVENKNAYDIQQYCLETPVVNLSKFLNESDLDKVKVFAFSEGKPLAYYAPVFGIPIRDKYFELKGIDISEVDKK